VAFDNTVVIVGNVTRDPEIRQTSVGKPITNLGIAWNNRYRKGEETVEESHFFDVVCFGQLAENISESITRGMRVVVYGRLNFKRWETEMGEPRQKVEIIADDVCPSLRWATAHVERNERTSYAGSTGGGGGFRGGGQYGGGQYTGAGGGGETRSPRDNWDNRYQTQGSGQTSGAATPPSGQDIEEPF